jgi:hypothetical protein
MTPHMMSKKLVSLELNLKVYIGTLGKVEIVIWFLIHLFDFFVRVSLLYFEYSFWQPSFQLEVNSNQLSINLILINTLLTQL